MKKNKEKSERSALAKLNNVLLVLHIICPIWLFAAISTYGFTKVLLPIVLVTSLVMVGVYKLVKKLDKLKPILTATRIIAIMAIIAFYLPLAGLLGFNSSKAFYPVKNFVYTKGVHGENYMLYKLILPDKLPDSCEDYYYRTKGNFIAQDYHPSSYLIFRTDAETLAEYDAYYESRCDIRYDKNDNFNEETGSYDENGRFSQKVDWLCGQTALRSHTSEKLDNSVIYFITGKYPKAVMLNPDTGLVVILT